MKNKNLFKNRGSVSAIIIIILLIGATFVALISSMMRSSDFYEHSVRLAVNNPEVQHALGEPVKSGWWVLGSISSGGLTEEAELRIPLNGSESNGTLFAAGRVDAGAFTYFNLVVQVSGTGEIIDLRR